MKLSKITFTTYMRGASFGFVEFAEVAQLNLISS